MTWRGTDVTVVVPTYNRADLIGKSIASIQAQTAPVTAIVIVDDGSTDDTRALVARLAVADPRITLVEQTNAGANVARNNGISHAATALVAFLDSDDRWEPTKIARQLAAWASRPDAVASFTGILAVDGDRPLYHYDIPADPTLDDLRRHNALGTTSAAMVRTDVLRSVGGFDPTLPSCQDWDLWLRLRRAGPFAVVTDSLVLYEDGLHERITGNPVKAIAGHRAVFAKALADVAGWRARARIRASHAEVLTRLFRRHGLRRDALVQAITAAALDPKRTHLRQLARIVLGR
ncbi:glycosyltransferase family A protein [Sphingomonas sp. BK069]|uniref:glycosyltransferase family 2 protein n=1 Tax=Sphingomonas sp. BK069 TaxID=2586979 RepID=UPI001617175F|nr:glycosyltransferase family A protein [Sphingomonas sp. BK069]MBB3348858.1 glycosyltransferase involved in cell wall biosynthesis [Sphingomonas sp. BK069]